MKTFLISEKYIKNFTMVMDNVDSKMLIMAIQESQEIDLNYKIGYVLYDLIGEQYDEYYKLKSEGSTPVKENIIEPRLIALVEKLKDYLKYRVLYNSRYSLDSKITNKGITQQHSDMSMNVDQVYINNLGKGWNNKSSDIFDNISDWMVKSENYPEYVVGKDDGYVSGFYLGKNI